MMRTSIVILLIAIAATLLGCGLFDDRQRAAESEGGATPAVSAASPRMDAPTSAANDESVSPVVSAVSPPVTAPTFVANHEEASPVSPLVATPTSAASDEEEPPRAPAATGARPIGYDGPSSLEERILASPVIARVRLDSVSSDAESGNTVNGMKHIPILEFSFSVIEYLKGSDANDIVAVWDAYPVFDTSQEAAAALPAIAAARDDQWDDHEAIVFLQPSQTYLPSTQRAGRFYLSWERGLITQDDGYSVASRYNKLWLPAEASVGTPSQPSGDQQRFLMDAPPATGTAPTMTLGELKAKVAAVTAKIDSGDGSEEYTECVRLTYQHEGIKRYRMAMMSNPLDITTPDHELESGLAASTVVYEDTGYGGLPNERGIVRFDGGDADLFSVEYGNPIPWDWSTDGVNDSIYFDRRVVATRPLPEGAYGFHFNDRAYYFVPCDGYTIRYEWTVTTNAPVGSLHEFFFDPVADGSAVAADATNGVLKPAAFTDANDAAASVSRIEWESDAVTMTVSPHPGLTSYFVDFIETDGSVSLSLAVSDATVDTANSALSWSVTTQPWEDGDLLMVRIREPYAPAPTNLRSSRAGNGYLIAWNAVSGASQYALQTRIPGVQDWTDTTPFAEEARQWYAPSQDLWRASS